MSMSQKEANTLIMDVVLKKNPELGVYWTYTPEKANSYNANNQPIDIFLKAVLNLKFINFLDSYFQNTSLLYQDEDEITVLKNSSIKVLNIQMKKNEKIINNISGLWKCQC